ncbi:prepilin-type N-terminal cleavage/methylation domain-containing protein [Patescibacteria group bacterium]|nr:prepilin-type N-terminal cleavage/methylation domain-containing protein [Patescibacteria group bacterium]
MEKTSREEKAGKKKYAGFTLIELLAVIAIIGLLAAAILASLNAARARSRDARRKADLNQIRVAVELYVATNGTLPGSSGPGNCNNAGGCNSTDAQPWIPGLIQQYISAIPVDPSNSATYRYRYRPNAATGDYEIDAPVEADYESAQNDGGNENICPSSSTCRYEIGTDLTRLQTGP